MYTYEMTNDYWNYIREDIKIQMLFYLVNDGQRIDQVCFGSKQVAKEVVDRINCSKDPHQVVRKLLLDHRPLTTALVN